MGTVSVWNDEKVLEMDGGDGCTTLWTFLMPLNCALKMVKMVNFMLYLYFTTIKNLITLGNKILRCQKRRDLLECCYGKLVKCRPWKEWVWQWSKAAKSGRVLFSSLTLVTVLCLLGLHPFLWPTCYFCSSDWKMEYRSKQHWSLHNIIASHLKRNWLLYLHSSLRIPGWGFPGGAVVKTPPANAGDTGSIPGPGRSHMPQSNWARVPQLLSLCSRAHEPQLLSPRAATTEAHVPRAHAPQQEKPLQWEARGPQRTVARTRHS